MSLAEGHAVEFHHRTTLRENAPGTVTLCPLGPLNQISRPRLLKAPDIADRIAKIVLMGGGYFRSGTSTPTAEFNIYVDSARPLTLCSNQAAHLIRP